MGDIGYNRHPDQCCDFDEELLFDIEMEVSVNATIPNTLRAVADVAADVNYENRAILKVSNLPSQNALQKQILSDVVAAKSQLALFKAGVPSLQSIAGSLPAYHSYHLFIREAVGSTSPPKCLTQLRHMFLVLASQPQLFQETCGMDIIIDPWFRECLIIGNATARYQALLDAVPEVYVGTSEELKQLITVIASEISKSYKTQGMPVPPWRTLKALLSKWLPAAPHDHPIGGEHSSLPTEPTWSLSACFQPDEPESISIPSSVPCLKPSPRTDLSGHAPAPACTVYGFAPPTTTSSQLPLQHRRRAGGAAEPAGWTSNMSLLHGMLATAKCAPGHVSGRVTAMGAAQCHAMLAEAPSLSAKQQPRKSGLGAALEACSKTVGGTKGSGQPLPDHTDFYHNVLLPIRKVKLSQKQGSNGSRLLSLKL